jgi:hypothetical protein
MRSEIQSHPVARAAPVSPRPVVSGWFPPPGEQRGRVKSIYLDEDLLTVNVIFCDGGTFLENSTFVVDRATPFFFALFNDAITYTGPVTERQGRIWEFDYMKIVVEMTTEGPAPWFLRSQLASLKIVPWPFWWDNRPKQQRNAA